MDRSCPSSIRWATGCQGLPGFSFVQSCLARRSISASSKLVSSVSTKVARFGFRHELTLMGASESFGQFGNKGEEHAGSASIGTGTAKQRGPLRVYWLTASSSVRTPAGLRSRQHLARIARMVGPRDAFRLPGIVRLVVGWVFVAALSSLARLPQVRRRILGWVFIAALMVLIFGIASFPEWWSR